VHGRGDGDGVSLRIKHTLSVNSMENESMAKEKEPVAWLTTLGRSTWETCNPFWYYCEKIKAAPGKVILLYDEGRSAEKDQVVQSFAILSRGYQKGTCTDIVGIGFDDKRIPEFNQTTHRIWLEAARSNLKLILDLSPTTWSFIPLQMMKMARSHRNTVLSVYYLNYSDHRLRNQPFPLVPWMGFTLQDLLIEPDTAKGASK